MSDRGLQYGIGHDDGSIELDSGGRFYRPNDGVVAGKRYVVETVGGLFGRFTGLREPYSDTWIVRYSDEDLRQERERMLADIEAGRRKDLAEHREEWAEREAKLSEPLRARLQNFRDQAGERFELDGWGYEVVVSELAELYRDSKLEETTEIDAYADEQGTSGNQHGFAKALARALEEDPAIVRTAISALSPITGEPYYVKKESK